MEFRVGVKLIVVDEGLGCGVKVSAAVPSKREAQTFRLLYSNLELIADPLISARGTPTQNPQTFNANA